MIQVNAIKNGKVVGAAAFKDTSKDTIRKSLASARNEMLKKGIEFDDLKAEFLGVVVDVEALERAFIAPTDPDLVRLRTAHEEKALSLRKK